MTIGTIGSGLLKLLASAGTRILKAIAEAKVENILKAGIFIGASIFSAYTCIKSAMKRHKAVKEQKNMSPVEQALAIDHANTENRRNLEPLMREVQDCFLDGKHKKFKKTADKRAAKQMERPKPRKFGTKQFGSTQEAIDDLRRYMRDEFPGCYDREGHYHQPFILDELKEMSIDYDAVLNLDHERSLIDDHFSIRRLWDDPNFI